MSLKDTADIISNSSSTRAWAVQLLQHVQGELRQREKDLRLKASQPMGGARSHGPKAALLIAEACKHAADVFDPYLELFPPQQPEEPAKKEVKPPLHPKHPDAKKGQRDVRG